MRDSPDPAAPELPRKRDGRHNEHGERSKHAWNHSPHVFTPRRPPYRVSGRTDRRIDLMILRRPAQAHELLVLETDLVDDLRVRDDLLLEADGPRPYAFGSSTVTSMFR